MTPCTATDPDTGAVCDKLATRDEDGHPMCADDDCECDNPDHHPCDCGRVPEKCDECGGAA